MTALAGRRLSDDDRVREFAYTVADGGGGSLGSDDHVTTTFTRPTDELREWTR